MTETPSVGSLLERARQTVEAASSAALITLDETGHPSARSVAAFPPDAEFARIVVGTHPASRKTVHVRRDPRVVMNYIDGPNRGYLSVVGMAQIDDAAGIAEKRSYWIDRFKAFFPAGPDSDEYQLMIVRPERLELRSFGLGVAAEPTRWSPVMLERDASGAWRQTN